MGASSREAEREAEHQQAFRFLSPRTASAVLFALSTAAVLTTAVFPILPPLHRAAAWALVLLVSFAGWGGLVGRLAFAGHRAADLGLRLAWGMAAVVAMGGAACLASLATRPALLALVVLGVVLQCDRVLRCAGGKGRGRRPTAAALLASAVVAVPAAIQLYGGAAGAGLSAADDFPVYLVFPKKILATGTLIEPFSMRRMAAYGGQSLLQALALLGCAVPKQIAVFDVGVCLLVVLVLLIDRRERHVPAWAWLPPVALLLTLPPLRINSASENSGLVFFLALYRTAAWSGFEPRSARAAAVLGLLAAGAASLRHSYVVPAALFLVFLYGPSVLRHRQRFAAAAVAGAAMLVFLLPWALLSQRSNATLLYPLFAGTYRSEYGHLTAANPVRDQATWLWTNLRAAWPVRTIAAFLLATLLVPPGRRRATLWTSAAAALCGFALVVASFPLSEPIPLSRYYFAFVFSAALAVTIHACSSSQTHVRRASTFVYRATVLMAIGVQVWLVGAFTQRYVYGAYVNLVRAAERRPNPLRDRGQRYRALQDSIPPGAPVLIMLDQPFWLDFRRNPIALVDLPGHSSPPPGMPTDDDHELTAYLTAQGFRYLAFVRPARSLNLYRRNKWERIVKLCAEPRDARHASVYVWEKAAPRYLEFFDRLESLMGSRTRSYDDGAMVAIDLAAAGTSAGSPRSP